MRDELNPAEERSLDVLLSEIHGASGPRDFAPEILSQLHNNHPTISPVKCAPRRRTRRSSKWVWMPLIAAVAASLVAAVWLGDLVQDGRLAAPKLADNLSAELSDRNQTRDGSDESRQNESSETPDPAATPGRPATSPIGTGSSMIAENSTQKAVEEERRIELANVSPEADGAENGVPEQKIAGLNTPHTPEKQATEQTATDDRARQPRRAKPPLQSMTLVSKQVDEQLQDYWKSIGLRPSDDATAATVAERVATAVEVKLTPDAFRNIDRLQQQLAAPVAARSIVESWLNRLSLNGFQRLFEGDRKALVSRLSDAVVQRNGFDRVVAGLIGGKLPEASTWYNAMGVHGEAAMYNRIASVALNADARCTRCHDDLAGGSARQQDYWSFAALMRNGLRQDELGGWQVLKPNESKRRPIFFDLPDGRRRLAEPAIPLAWAKGQSFESVSGLNQWSKVLPGSQVLAKGIVNSLWQTLHGRPLRSSTVDVATSPEQDSLVQLEQRLADDLLASDFDVARTLALMISSPAFNRTVPAALRPKQSLLANRKQIEHANRMVGAYAASAPPQAKVPMHRKVAMVIRSAESKMGFGRGDAATMLGQADDSATAANLPDRKAQARRKADETASGFPTDVDASIVDWIESIESFEEQVRHLNYLSGRGRLPLATSEAVDAMRKSSIDDHLTLHRTWWMLSQYRTGQNRPAKHTLRLRLR